MEPYTPYRPYKPRERKVSVSEESGPDEVELPGRVGWFSGPAPSGAPSRGPVRLRVVMPAPDVAGWTYAVFITIAVGVAGILGSALGLPGLYLLCCIADAYLIFGVAVSAMWLRPWAQDEILMVDSRLVTLHRDKALKGVWGRHQFEDVRVNRGEGKRPVRRAGHRPTLVWGGRNASAGAGAGITIEEAESLLVTIREFMDEHPPDRTLDYRGSGTPFA